MRTVNLEKTLAQLKELKGEPKGFDRMPNPLLPDYSIGCVLIRQCITPLEESIEDGQELRARTALSIIEDSAALIREWIDAAVDRTQNPRSKG